MEAKKQGEEDLSMEEILQSIRKIIADEGDEGKPAGGVADVSYSASDILELTDMITDDGSVVNVAEVEKAGVATDILSDIDAALAPESKAELEVKQEVKPEPIAAVETPKIIAEEIEKPHETTAFDNGALLSEAAQGAAIASLTKLKNTDEPLAPLMTTPSPVFRSGMTVEDMVAEMLKPMMKEWLDKNLPAIVERIVEREVMRLTRR